MGVKIYMFNNMAYVYEVYKEKSFSRAAENLYITQPSLSATVKKVEAQLDAPLFDRSTNPVQLTDCGREYINCVEKIMDIENGFANDLADLSGAATGNLTVGANSFFCSYILPSVITGFIQRYPRVNIKLVEADTSSLEKQLFNGGLDIVVDSYDFGETAYQKHHFYSETMLLAVPQKYVEAGKFSSYRLALADIIAGRHLDNATMSVPLGMLAHVPFILLKPKNSTRVVADRVFAQTGIIPNVILELDQLATAYRLSCHGMGATIASDTLVMKMSHYRDICYFKMEAHHARRDNAFFYKKNKYVTRAMQEFVRIATELQPSASNG